MRSILSLAPVALLCAAAQAQVNPVGPFTGAASEGFEASTAGMFSVCIQPDIFGATASLCTPTGSGAHVTGGWSFGCQIGPHSGTRLSGSAGGYYELTFFTPASKFGGYFGNNSPNAGVVDFIFFDDAGNQIDLEQVPLANDCTWNWAGWETTGADIKRIEIRNSNYGGAFVMMDDLEVDYGTGGGPGTNYCQAVPNSTGNPGAISASGSAIVANNNLTLHATDLPLNQSCYFLNSLTQGFLPNPGGSQGNLCLSGAIGRYNIPAGYPVANTGSSGSASLLIDNTNTPTPTGATSILAGETWNFQAWYRDGNNNNFTDGLSVVFL